MVMVLVFVRQMKVSVEIVGQILTQSVCEFIVVLVPGVVETAVTVNSEAVASVVGWKSEHSLQFSHEQRHRGQQERHDHLRCNP